MAARVNTRFILLLSLSLVVLIGGAAAVYVVFLKKNPAQLMAEGDQFVVAADANARRVDELEGQAAQDAFAESGLDYQLAAEKYDKAFAKDSTNVDLLLKYIDAIKRMHVDTTNRAGHILREMDAKLKLATQISDREDILERYYQETLDQLLWGGGVDAANQIIGRIASHVTNKLETDPTNRTALKYQGIIRTLRLDTQSSDYDDYQDARDDLIAAAEQLPDDALVRMYLAKWHIAEARRVKSEAEGVIENVEEAKKISAEALAMDPEDLEVQFKRIEVLLAHPIYRSKKDVPENDEAQIEAITQSNKAIIEQVHGLVDKLEQRLHDDPRPMDAVLRLCDIMTRLNRDIIKVENGIGQTTTGMQRTEKLLRQATKAQPLNIIYRTYLGNILKLQMNLDGALAAYRGADEIANVGTAEMVVRELHFKRSARYEIANIELIQAENEKDQDVREQKLKNAEAAIEHLDQVLDSKAAIWMLRGKVSMLRGNNPLAAQQLDKAVDLFMQDGNHSVEAILLSARAHQRGQQWGTAAERLETIVRLAGIANNPESEARIRVQLAEIYINANELDRAEFQLKCLREGRTAAEDNVPEDIPALAPDDPSTKILVAGYELKRGNVDEAARLYAEIDALKQPSVLANLARSYRTRGQADQARKVLADYLADNPADIGIIREYAQITDTDADRRVAAIGALLDRAQEAGAPADAVRALRVGATPVGQATEGSHAEFVDAMTGTITDDLTAELRRAGLWQRLGDTNKARAAFRRAEAINPDHPQVIMMGISYAAQDKDQAKLGRLATRAAEENIDLAGGDFIRGQIAAAENNLTQAITFYNQGLEKRPVYDEGWKVLGDLYMRHGTPDQAAEAYRTAIKQKPNNVGALVGLSDAHLRRNRSDAAVQALRDAVRHNDTNTALVRRYLATETKYGDANYALEFQRRIAARYPNVLENRIAVALLLVETGQEREATEELITIEKEFGPSLRTTSARAAISQRSGDAQGGKQAFDAYLADRGDQATPEDYAAAARFLRAADLSEAATEMYEQAISLDTSPTREATRELADYLFSIGRFEDAAAKYDAVLANAVDAADAADRERLMRRQTETLLRLGDADRADALLATQPDAAPVLMLRSMVARQRGDEAKAMSLLDDAIAADPDYAVGYLQRGLLHLANDPDAALADANKAAELDASLIAARRLQAQVMLIQGRPDEAIAGLNAVLADTPGDSVSRIALIRLSIERNDFDAGRELLAQGQREDPNNPAWPQIGAQLAMAGGDPAETIARLEEAITSNPRAISVLALAEAYLNQNRARDAVALFDRHPKLVNANIPLQARRGQALIKAGNLEGGARVLALAMQRAPNRGQLMIAARAAQVALGADRSLQLLDLAAQAAPANRLNFELAKSAVLVGNGKFEQALEILPGIEALAADADAAALLDVYRMMAMCYHQTQQYGQAAAAYRKVLDASPDDIEVLNNLAYLLANDLSDPQAALPLAEKAVALTQPPQATVLDTLGFVQLRLGDAKNARQTLEKAVSLREMAAIHFHLAQAYFDLGMTPEARQSLQTAIDMAQSTGDQDTLEKALRLQESL